MVDREARKILAEQLRHFVSGRITNDEFESAVLAVRTNDRGYWAVVEQTWLLYSDLSQHKLTPHSLSPDLRRMISRSILFLHSDVEYEWPRHGCTGFIRLLAVVASLGHIPKYYDKKWKAEGDYDVYPFFRQRDFERAKNTPRLLTGGGRSPQ